MMSAAENKISPIAENCENTITCEEKEEEKPLISKVGKFNLSLYDGTFTLKAQGIDETLYFVAPYNIECDKELMENSLDLDGNHFKDEFKLGEFNLSVDNDKLTLKIPGSLKSFIFDHKLDITEESAENLQNEISADYLTPRETSSCFPQDNHFIISSYDTKITMKTEEGEIIEFPDHPDKKDEYSRKEINLNGPEYIHENQIGVKTKENDKTFVLKHTVNIKVNDEKPAENIKNAVEKFEIIITCGDGTLKTHENDESFDFKISFRLEADMNNEAATVGSILSYSNLNVSAK
ncbi:uncharacterized protein LOC122852183 [Aphidius gifuensis]|nr:uncharacterized protein LOC122852183 [Aphidius gifuensis]